MPLCNLKGSSINPQLLFSTGFQFSGWLYLVRKLIHRDFHRLLGNSVKYGDLINKHHVSLSHYFWWDISNDPGHLFFIRKWLVTHHPDKSSTGTVIGATGSTKPPESMEMKIMKIFGAGILNWQDEQVRYLHYSKHFWTARRSHTPDITNFKRGSLFLPIIIYFTITSIGNVIVAEFHKAFPVSKSNCSWLEKKPVAWNTLNSLTEMGYHQKI